MCDIALGIKHAGLDEFAKRVNAADMSRWAELGLYEDAEGWGSAFHQAVTNTLNRDGRIHFNLDQLDINEALAGNPDEFVGRYTAYELQQIVRHAAWFEQTTFYMGGNALTREELTAIGVTPPIGNDH